MTARTRLPFTKRERHRAAQNGLGYRATNDWGGGDLPAPWAEGDIVRLDAPYPKDETGYDRLRGQGPGFFIVTYGPSIDEGDGWYFRVWDGESECGSDRLHVFYPERCAAGERGRLPEPIDFMAPFVLVDTADPEGLAKREAMIADGWSFTDRWETCPTCGHTTRKRS